MRQPCLSSASVVSSAESPVRPYLRPAPPCPALPRPAPPCPALPRPTLPCPALPCLCPASALPCPASALPCCCIERDTLAIPHANKQKAQRPPVPKAIRGAFAEAGILTGDGTPSTLQLSVTVNCRQASAECRQWTPPSAAWRCRTKERRAYSSVYPGALVKAWFVMPELRLKGRGHGTQTHPMGDISTPGENLRAEGRNRFELVHRADRAWAAGVARPMTTAVEHLSPALNPSQSYHFQSCWLCLGSDLACPSNVNVFLASTTPEMEEGHDLGPRANRNREGAGAAASAQGSVT